MISNHDGKIVAEIILKYGFFAESSFYGNSVKSQGCILKIRTSRKRFCLFSGNENPQIIKQFLVGLSGYRIFKAQRNSVKQTLFQIDNLYNFDKDIKFLFSDECFPLLFRQIEKSNILPKALPKFVIRSLVRIKHLERVFINFGSRSLSDCLVIPRLYSGVFLSAFPLPSGAV